MRKTSKYLAVGMGVTLSLSSIGIGSASAATQMGGQRYSRHIDAGNMSAPATTTPSGTTGPVMKKAGVANQTAGGKNGKDEGWEPQTGFTGGKAETVDDLASTGKLSPEIAKSVLTGASSFKLDVPNGKYKMSAYVVAGVDKGPSKSGAFSAKQETTSLVTETNSEGTTVTANGKSVKVPPGKDGNSSVAVVQTTKDGVTETSIDTPDATSKEKPKVVKKDKPAPVGPVEINTAGKGIKEVRANATVTNGVLSLAFTPADNDSQIAALVIKGNIRGEKPAKTTTKEKTSTPDEEPTTKPIVKAAPKITPASTRPENQTCAKPKFTTSDPNGMFNDGGYIVHNNMWNAKEGGKETLYVCAYNNWYVTATMPDTTSVKTYPNVHKDYDMKPISSFKTLESSFAATSPHVGIYNVAYDIWINGVAEANSTEIMIWTENFNQKPSGEVTATVQLGSQTYDVWTSNNNKYIAFVPKKAMTSGSIDLLELFKWTIQEGLIPADSTVGQIDFGVEICSTDNKAATFKFTDFSITES